MLSDFPPESSQHGLFAQFHLSDQYGIGFIDDDTAKVVVSLNLAMRLGDSIKDRFCFPITNIGKQAHVDRPENNGGDTEHQRDRYRKADIPHPIAGQAS